MTDLNPGKYTSDDLDRLVREADRKAAKLRHVEDDIEKLLGSVNDDDEEA